MYDMRVPTVQTQTGYEPRSGSRHVNTDALRAQFQQFTESMWGNYGCTSSVNLIMRRGSGLSYFSSLPYLSTSPTTLVFGVGRYAK